MIHTPDTQYPEQLYIKGIKELKQGRVEKAISMFEEVIDRGYESAELYNNIGTSFMLKNKIGLAILNYEKALLLSPRNSVIQKNYLVAKNTVPENFISIQQPIFYNYFRSISNRYTVNELTIAGEVLLVLGLSCLTISLYKNKIKKWIGKGLVSAAIFVITAAILQFYNQKNCNRAIILAKEIIVKNAASLQAKDSHILYEGTIIELEDNFAGWSKISWSRDKKGWIKEKSIKKIRL